MEEIKKKRVQEKDALKFMLSAKYYNECRILGYNHLTGHIENIYATPGKGMKVYSVDRKILPV